MLETVAYNDAGDDKRMRVAFISRPFASMIYPTFRHQYHELQSLLVGTFVTYTERNTISIEVRYNRQIYRQIYVPACFTINDY